MRMEILRDKLNKLLASKDCDKTQILKLSQELDELINSYMKQQN